MKSIIAIFPLLLTVGCGDDADHTARDMAMSTDLTVIKNDCDVGKQDCGAGRKCVGQVIGASGEEEIVGVCVADGTVGEGGACTRQMSDDTYLDDCQAGFICDSLYGNFELVCRKICSEHTDCAANEKCGDFTFLLPGWGWCAPTCTPYSTAAGNCPQGMDCGETAYDVYPLDDNLEYGFFLCKDTGGGSLFASCNSDADCGANLWCGTVNPNTGAAACLPNCDDNHECAQPDGDAGMGNYNLNCHPLVGQPDNAGYCYPG
jgi:hypothetical protein